MVDEALGAGLQIVAGWLGCARNVVQRLQDAVEPVARLAGLSASRTDDAPSSPTTTPAEPEPTAPQTEVEEAKYHLGRAGEQRSAARYADRETGELPRAYGRDRIVLLPRDPWWAFAYWEITPTTRVRALRALGSEAEGAREVLRVYDVTFLTFTGDNAWLSFDVELTPGADRWYLNLGRPAASFCVEIGLRTPGGRFLPLARSNTVTTPRSSPSPDTSVRWVDVRHGTPGEAPSWNGQRMPAGDDLSPQPTDERPRSSDVHAPPPR